MSDSKDQQVTVRSLDDVTAAGEDETFGRFNPMVDADGAAKFALAAIGRGRGLRLPSLATLLTEKSSLGELEGEPGWTLERRDDGNNMPGYAAWPEGAKYRAHVEPDSYRLPWPEVYYDRSGFHSLVAAMIANYEKNHPDQADVVSAVRAKL